MSKRITFVIGAGASCGAPFNLLTAKSLVDAVIETKPSMFISDPKLPDWVNEQKAKESNESAAAFAVKLKRAGAPSLDRFLESHANDRSYGKWATAKILLSREAGVVRSGRVASGWYSWILDQMLDAPDRLVSGDVQFVTFNYDRILEFAIWSKCHYGLNWDRSRSCDFVSRVPIRHVYGRFAGDIDPVECDHLPAYSDDVREIELAAAGIRIISEDRDARGDEVFSVCRKAVQSAEVLVFLGVGYDRLNLERIGALGIADSSARTKVFGSAKGLLNGERRRVSQLLGSRVGLAEEHHDCLDTLRYLVADQL